MKYTIKTPNKNYNGVTYGISFVDGVATTDDEKVKNVLVNDFGYSVEITEDKKEVKPKNTKSSKK